MPMIDFSVVVLPAPLRPRSVTTSPSRTSKVTPCKMCDSPYQASRFSMVSKGSGARSSMAHSHIGLAHVRIIRHGLVIALGEHAAAREHRDAVGQVCDQR